MSIKWIKTEFAKEKDEFERVVNNFSGNNLKARKENLKEIQSLYSKSNLVTLTDSMWKYLDNTDSWRTTSISKINYAINRNSSSSGKRSIENILKEFINGSVRAPIILEYNEGKDRTLIAGNTRLMVSRMLEITPKVVLIKSDW